MITSISLESFKCFNNRQDIPLSQINLLYGKNGRGKSTLTQSILLLSQSIDLANDIENLQFVGKFLDLGVFDDVLNNNAIQPKFKFWFNNNDEKIELEFNQNTAKPQTGKLCGLTYNGINRFDEKSDASLESDNETKTVGTVSDINLIQEFKYATYVSAGRLGPVNSVKRNDNIQENWIGINGEYIINTLSSKGQEFINEIGQVLSEILSGAAIEVKQLTYDIKLMLGSTDNPETFLPVNVGFGYSYILPVITATLLAKEGSILIIENPEAHLHPGAQSRLTKFLIKQAKIKNLQLFIETHSDHVINGLRIAMKQRYAQLTPNDAEIIYFSHTNTHATPKIEIISCDSNGELNSYPDDFLDEWTKQMINLI